MQLAPFRFAAPEKLAAGGFLIYIPDWENVGLTAGRAYGGGLYMLGAADMEQAQVEYADGLEGFQFLAIASGGSKAEWASNGHFSHRRIELGPFISADYSLEGNSILVSARAFEKKRGVEFIIAGMPEGARLSCGRQVGDGEWRLSGAQAGAFEFIPHARSGDLRVSLSIIARRAGRNPELSYFNLIIPLRPRAQGDGGTYREMKIRVARILKGFAARTERHILSITGTDGAGDFYVHPATLVGERWVVAAHAREKIVRDFSRGRDRLALNLHLMTANEKRGYTTATRRMTLDFDDARAGAKGRRVRTSAAT